MGKILENQGFFLIFQKNKKIFKKIWNFLKLAPSDTIQATNKKEKMKTK